MLPRYLILLLLIVTFSSCDFTSATSYVEKSKLAIEKEDYRSAINLLNKAIDKDPLLKEAYLQRGYCYQNNACKDSAINDFKSLLILDPTNASAWYYTGLCKYGQNKFKEAIESFSKALVIKEDSTTSNTNNPDKLTDSTFIISAAQLYFQRGLAYFATDQVQNANHDFQFCIAKKYKPDECNYLCSLCRQAGNKNNTGRELNNLNSAAEKNIMKNCLSHLCR